MAFIRRAKAGRAAVSVLASVLLVLVLFSILYPIAEADHECIGEDCPVCACIRWCETNLGTLRTGIVKHAPDVLPAVLILLPVLPVLLQAAGGTPVLRKVRLND